MSLTRKEQTMRAIKNKLKNLTLIVKILLRVPGYEWFSPAVREFMRTHPPEDTTTKEESMIKCNTCEFCDVNTNSDEAYCEANDGEQIILYRGQCRPRWCPKQQARKMIEEKLKGVRNV